MSDSEKFEEQGRAHAALKEAKANSATLRAALLRHSQRLGEMSAFIKQFLADPLAVGSSQMPMAEHIKADYRNLTSSSFEGNVDQLVAEIKRMHELQQQVDHF